METKLAIYAVALVLSIGLLAITYTHEAFARQAYSTGSGDTKASADVKQKSDQDIKQKIQVESGVSQSADCSGSSGGSGSFNGNSC